MKKYFILVFMASLFLGLYAHHLKDEVSVHVKKAVLRSKPSFLGKKMGQLKYADRVEVLKENKTWYQIRTARGVVAWLHKSSTTEDEIKLTVGSNTKQVSDKEQAIAGKGYNEQVEKEYRKTKPYNYPWVDKMQNSWNASDEDIQQFIKEGQLYPVVEGGQ